MLADLSKNINLTGNLAQSDIELFIGSLEEVHLKKGEHLLHEGQVCQYLFYVQSGLLMVYKTNDGIVTPHCFTAEKEWVGLMKSFNEKIPTDKAIKALEDTVLFRLSADKLKQICEDQPKFLVLKNQYLESNLLEVTHQIANLRLLAAKARYYQFMKEKPTLINRVPQYYIAAYLGIKPQSLSRIRKEG